MKYLITIILLSFSLQSFASETAEPAPSINDVPVIIVPLPPGEGDIADEPAESLPNLSEAECRKMAQQLLLLSQIISAADAKTSQMRAAMDVLHEEGIDPLLTYSGIDFRALNTVLEAYWQTSKEHDKVQQQRNVAYDKREEVFQKMTAQCNYKPEGKS